MSSATDRADVLRGLAAGGADAVLCASLAVELGLPEADLLVVAGLPVPERSLPPERKGLGDFADRVAWCDHAQLAALTEFVRALPDLRPDGRGVVPAPRKYMPLEVEEFSRVLDDMVANRGFTMAQLSAVTRLALVAVHGMLAGRAPSRFRPRLVRPVAAALGWAFQDLAPLAGVDVEAFRSSGPPCRHVGWVFEAAVPLTTAQSALASEEADRLSGRLQRVGQSTDSAVAHDECPLDGR